MRRVIVTQDKLDPLEARIAALEERNRRMDEAAAKGWREMLKAVQAALGTQRSEEQQ